MKEKIVLWMGDHPFPIAQANRFAEKFNVVGVVFERRKHDRLKANSLNSLLEKIFSRIFLSKIHISWKHLSNYFRKQYPRYPQVPTLVVENINSEEAYGFTIEKKPDLILVSGTRLVRKKMLSIKPTIGILNLHTGLSPYVNGGPSCTNWCLSNDEIHLIGNTVMWIDAGIDSGNIITTETVSFTGDESLNDIHIKVMDAGQNLYEKAVSFLLNHRDKCPNIRQETLGAGNTYYNKMWGLTAKINLLRNLKKFKNTIRSKEFQDKINRLKLVKLPESYSPNESQVEA